MYILVICVHRAPDLCPVALWESINPWILGARERTGTVISLYCSFWEEVRTSLVAQTVKRLPIMRETWVRSLDPGDPLEKEMATPSSTLAWKIPWMEEPGRLQSMGSQRVRHNWATSLRFTSAKAVSKYPCCFKTSFWKHESQCLLIVSRARHCPKLRRHYFT